MHKMLDFKLIAMYTAFIVTPYAPNLKLKVNAFIIVRFNVEKHETQAENS